jgi:hypothetical protein
MTKHLSAPEFVDALEARVAPAVQAHLDCCARCAAQLADLRHTMARASEQQDVPEPSPLFWDHFSARVRAAVDAEPVPVPFWTQWWRPIVALGAMTAVAALVVWLRAPVAPAVDRPAPLTTTAAVTAPVTPSVAVPGVTNDEDDLPWILIVAMASDLSHEDLHQMVPSDRGGAGSVEDLTPAQREAFVQLVRQQMGGTE